MHYPDLTIRGFRGIKELTLPKLGRVNLLAGKNNTGKSSVLEALLLHAQNGSPEVIKEILAFREEMTLPASISQPSAAFEITNLFHGYPSLTDEFHDISISTSGVTNPLQLTMSVNWLVERMDGNGNVRLVDPEIKLFWNDSADVPVLRIKTEMGVRTQRLDRRPGYMLRGHAIIDPLAKDRMPLEIVSSGYEDETDLLGILWDQITLTDMENDAIDVLRLFDPSILDFSMVAGEAPGQRVGMVRAKNIDHPVPLRSFGDGMNRLFGIALSLVNAHNGILLVDEFENGLHYSVQPDAWRMVFKLARDLDVQVFATTHSRDAISSFQEVAAECEDLGVLIRLNRRGDVIMPITYSEDELAIANRYAIEVR